MNYKTHKWKWLLGLALAAGAITLGALWYFDGRENSDAVANFTAPLSRENAAEAQALMASVPTKLATYASLQAKLRQRVNIMGFDMTGSGGYLQGDPARHLTQVSFRLQFQESLLSWRQVCDGRSLWTAEKGLEGRQKISRVDLESVQAELAAPGSLHNWGAGGLPQFMRNLNSAFEFTRTERVWLDTIRARYVVGKWRPEKLAKLLKDRAEELKSGGALAPEEIPSHLPQAVAVTLGSEDLFPYRIEFLRQGDDGVLQPTVTIELFEVRFDAQVDPSQFIFTTHDEEIRDGTKGFLETLNWTAGDSKRPLP